MMRFVLLLLLSWASFVGAEPERSRVKAPEVSEDNSPAAVEAARARGAQTATEDIRSGRAVVLYYGKPWSAGKPLVDDATGLPVQIVGGCVVTDVFRAEVTAYNEVVRSWHAQKNSPTTP